MWELTKIGLICLYSKVFYWKYIHGLGNKSYNYLKLFNFIESQVISNKNEKFCISLVGKVRGRIL